MSARSGPGLVLVAGSTLIMSVVVSSVKAPEAPSASVEAKSESLLERNMRTGSFADEFSDKNSQTVKSYTPADLQAFDESMKGLEGIVRPDVLKPLVSLRQKL